MTERIPVAYLAPWVGYGGSDKNTIDWFRWIDRERFAPYLIATQPCTQTAQGPRYSVINGLPQSVINITLDGVNTQDNSAKSTDGVFKSKVLDTDNLFVP